jgi:23S rRNA (uracil1939-C5)-methyltransferase
MTLVAMKTEIVTLEKYAYGGECFGRLEDQRAVFIPFSLPGERVRIQLIEEKKGYARGKLLEILEASPDRIEPRCIHFTQCGGCHYQNIPYETQVQIKTDILRDQLVRIGKLVEPMVKPAIASRDWWHYRNHVQFHLTPEEKLGFQASRSHEVIPIQVCYLPEKPIDQTWRRLDMEAIPGLERLSLRLGVDEDVLLILESSDLETVDLEVDLPISVVQSSPGGLIVLAGDDHIFCKAASRVFRVSAESFFQVNTHMATEMVNHILENLPIPENATLIDAYCGVGLFSAFLAGAVQHLIGIETSPSACEDYVTNLDEFDNVALYEAQVSSVLPTLELRPDILIVDPPRAGLDHATMDSVLSLGVKDIVYVSCDPATLARDARRLCEGGYQLKQVTPFDLFPQTYHIESISFFTK